MNKKVILLIQAIVMLFYCQVSAQKTITLDDAIAAALKNNKDIVRANMEVKRANAAVKEAYGYAMPTVNFSASLSHFIEKPMMLIPDFTGKGGPSTLMSFSQFNNYETKIEAFQILFNSAVFTGIGASQQYLSTSQELLKSSVAKTITDIRKAFYGVILTRELLTITKASYENGKANLHDVKLLLQEGLVSEFDALQAEVQVENIKPIVLQMENVHQQALDGLKDIMGTTQKDSIDVVGEITFTENKYPEVEQAITSALKMNYDLNSLRAKIQVDEAIVDLKRAEYWPTVAAFANYTKAGASDKWNFINYNSGIVGVSLSINLFSGMQTSHRVEQSLIEKSKTEQQIFQLEDVIAMQIKTKMNDINRTKSLIEAQERNVKLAQKAYDIALIRYKEGTGSQMEIQNSDLALRAAKTNRLQSYYDFIVANTEYENLLGNIDQKYFNMVVNN